MNFLDILEEASTIQEARQAVKEIEEYLNSLQIYSDNRKYIKYVQEAIIKLSDTYSRNALVFAAQMIRSRHNKNIGSVAYLTKNPLSESVQTKTHLNYYIKWIFFRIHKQVPSLKNTFAMAQVILEFLGKELRQFDPKQLSYFVKGVERYIYKYNSHYKGDILKYLNAYQNPEDIYSNINQSEAAQFRIESVNPYLTQSQKYAQNHPNRNGHQHSMRRTTGNDTDRKRKTMVPNVRQNLKNPYKAEVVNKAQTRSKILTPLELQQIAKDYGIDIDDRRVKTIKGKTNMILTPLKNGGWELGHK